MTIEYERIYIFHAAPQAHVTCGTELRETSPQFPYQCSRTRVRTHIKYKSDARTQRRQISHTCPAMSYLVHHFGACASSITCAEYSQQYSYKMRVSYNTKRRHTRDLCASTAPVKCSSINSHLLSRRASSLIPGIGKCVPVRKHARHALKRCVVCGLSPMCNNL